MFKEKSQNSRFQLLKFEDFLVSLILSDSKLNIFSILWTKQDIWGGQLEHWKTLINMPFCTHFKDQLIYWSRKQSTEPTVEVIICGNLSMSYNKAEVQVIVWFIHNVPLLHIIHHNVP